MEQETKLDGTITRWIHPLLLAHASTYHKAQGLTLRNGVVMMPPSLRSNPQLGLAYVGISRVTRLDGPRGLTLLRPLHTDHFSGRTNKRDLIVEEYVRLRNMLIPCPYE